MHEGTWGFSKLLWKYKLSLQIFTVLKETGGDIRDGFVSKTSGGKR